MIGAIMRGLLARQVLSEALAQVAGQPAKRPKGAAAAAPEASTASPPSMHPMFDAKQVNVPDFDESIWADIAKLEASKAGCGHRSLHHSSERVERGVLCPSLGLTGASVPHLAAVGGGAAATCGHSSPLALEVPSNQQGNRAGLRWSHRATGALPAARDVLASSGESLARVRVLHRTERSER